MKITHRRYLKIIWLCLLGSMIHKDGWAVEDYAAKVTDPLLQSWRWQSFSQLNGKGYRCMAEAADRSVWFGVDQGVMRYDGINWTLFTPDDGLIGAPVTALLSARDGSIYAGTDKGVSRFKNGTWQRILPAEKDFTEKIYHIYQTSDGSLWLGIDSGALRIEDRHVTLYTMNNDEHNLKKIIPNLKIAAVPFQLDATSGFSTYRFHQDRKGFLWFGLLDGTLVRHTVDTAQPEDPSAWQIVDRHDGLDVGQAPSMQ